MRKLMNEPDLSVNDTHLQDIYSELRYLVYVLEGVAKTLRKLTDGDE